jgi:hydrogenase nickel incorporation protein HypB
MATLKEHTKRLNPGMAIFEGSCKTGDGIEAWTEWLAAQVAAFIQ